MNLELFCSRRDRQVKTACADLTAQEETVPRVRRELSEHGSLLDTLEDGLVDY